MRFVLTSKAIRNLGFEAAALIARSAVPAFPLQGVSWLLILRCENHMWRLLKEFLLFARQEKKWWLIPLVVVFLVLGAILIFASSSGIAWALYPFF
jgi:hypothetical protein